MTRSARRRSEQLGKVASTFSGSRDVATTLSPRANAARTSSDPKPPDVPVMNQVSGDFFMTPGYQATRLRVTGYRLQEKDKEKLSALPLH